MDLFSAPFHLVHDPEMLIIDDVKEAEFLSADNKKAALLKSIRQNKGRVAMSLTRLGDAGGRTGSGKLASVVIVPKKPGSTRLILERLEFRTPDLRPTPVQATPTTLVFR